MSPSVPYNYFNENNHNIYRHRAVVTAVNSTEEVVTAVNDTGAVVPAVNGPGGGGARRHGPPIPRLNRYLQAQADLKELRNSVTDIQTDRRQTDDRRSAL
uniref:Uncharacterized protein n=1 Tax=Haemonchus contortus TaxID=6289 RepID=A0A7I4YF28_HAECO